MFFFLKLTFDGWKGQVPWEKTDEDGIDTWYPFCRDGHSLRIGTVALLHRKVVPIIQ